MQPSESVDHAVFKHGAGLTSGRDARLSNPGETESTPIPTPPIELLFIMHNTDGGPAHNAAGSPPSGDDHRLTQGDGERTAGTILAPGLESPGSAAASAMRTTTEAGHVPPLKVVDADSANKRLEIHQSADMTDAFEQGRYQGSALVGAGGASHQAWLADHGDHDADTPNASILGDGVAKSESKFSGEALSS